jgi:hypothetical protein
MALLYLLMLLQIYIYANLLGTAGGVEMKAPLPLNVLFQFGKATDYLGITSLVGVGYALLLCLSPRSTSISAIFAAITPG